MKIIKLDNSPVDMTLAELEQAQGLEMVVQERTPPEAKRYGRFYAQLQDERGYGINTCDNPTQRSFFQGFTMDGATPDEAIQSYLKRISGQYIVPDMTDASKDFWCGQITYTPA
jgi:hypothetical protein